MVCSLKSGRMAAFARLLTAGSISQTLAEELDCQKLTPKYLHRELREADEANLLDEEDMHMFGLRPMSDPLYLVCCNACKKPIKASHYAAHAELCKSLNYNEEIVSEVDGASGQKKLPRKDRKKLHVAHAGNTNCVNETPRMNSLKVNTGNMERSETVISSSTKCVKRAISEIQSCFDVGTPCITSEDILQCRELPTRSSGGSEKISKDVVGNQTSDQIYENLVTKDVPAPLATKMYYSQRNHYLRRVISHMYYAESRKEQSSEFLTSEEFRVNSEQTQTLSPSYLNHGQVENPQRRTFFASWTNT